MCAALNPMAAAFGLSSGAVAVAAAAAAAVFGGGGGVNNPGGNVGGGAGPGNNLLVNLNNASYSLRIHDNTASSGTSPSSSSDYHTDRNEWMNRIESAHIDRTLMNKLVMNYLVTGEKPSIFLELMVHRELMLFTVHLQRASKKRQTSLELKPAYATRTTPSRSTNVSKYVKPSRTVKSNER